MHYNDSDNNSNNNKQVCVDPQGIIALTPSTHCCALAQAADMDRKTVTIDGTDRRTLNGRTPDHYIDRLR